VIDDRVRAEMKKILGEIQSGAFAREWDRREPRRPGELPALARGAGEDRVETVGQELRSHMDWIKPDF